MGWTYYEYLAQPEWFIVALARTFKQMDERENSILEQSFGTGSVRRGRK